MSKKNKKFNNNQTQNNGPKSLTWDIHEYHQPDRNRNWYIIAALVALALIAWAIYDHNYFFALIILMGGGLMIYLENNEPEIMNFALTPAGVELGDKLYNYDEFQDFAVVYRPHEETRRLYFVFKATFRPRLSIPLNQINPLTVRQYLLKYLREDLERTNIPLSEGLARMFKL